MENSIMYLYSDGTWGFKNQPEAKKVILYEEYESLKEGLKELENDFKELRKRFKI